jgi:hypothetical protein
MCMCLLAARGLAEGWLEERRKKVGDAGTQERAKLETGGRREFCRARRTKYESIKNLLE